MCDACAPVVEIQLEEAEQDVSLGNNNDNNFGFIKCYHQGICS